VVYNGKKNAQAKEVYSVPLCMPLLSLHPGITVNILSPSSQEVSLRRSQTSVASTVPELPGLSDRHNLVEESTDDLVQGTCSRQAKCYIVHQKLNTISVFSLDNDKCVYKVKSTMQKLVWLRLLGQIFDVSFKDVELLFGWVCFCLFLLLLFLFRRTVN